jgi:zinc finger CCHC domain-containing protein 8
LQRPFYLETVNILEKGQEEWKKKYVHWIPVLHLEGREIAKGRWGSLEVNQALDSWEQEMGEY